MQLPEGRSPLDQALDVVFYAPVGLVVTAGEDLPRLIEKGRAQVSGQVALARLVGRFAVAQGQREASKAVKQAAQLLIDLGVLPGERTGMGPAAAPVHRTDHPPDGSDPDAVRPVPDEDGDATAELFIDHGELIERLGRTAPIGQDLAIPGYDALSASQVVQRLDGLSPGELEEVRAYELATRGRRTILNKIAQLQSGSL
jgi:hypothetical protein